MWFRSVLKWLLNLLQSILNIRPKEQEQEKMDPTQPLARPLSSLNALFKFKPSRETSWNVCRLKRRDRLPGKGFFHIVCHDMAGGYHEDGSFLR